MDLPEFLKLLAPVLLGVLGGWMSGLLAGGQRAREAIAVWERSRQDAAATLTVDLVKEIATELATASHSICWLTWRAKVDPEHLASADIAKYDWEMHERFPKILGAQAALASLSGKTADQVEAVVDAIVALDVRVNEACIAYAQGERAAPGALHDAALDYQDRLLKALKGIAAQVLGSRSNLSF